MFKQSFPFQGGTDQASHRLYVNPIPPYILPPRSPCSVSFSIPPSATAPPPLLRLRDCEWTYSNEFLAPVFPKISRDSARYHERLSPAPASHVRPLELDRHRRPPESYQIATASGSTRSRIAIPRSTRWLSPVPAPRSAALPLPQLVTPPSESDTHPPDTSGLRPSTAASTGSRRSCTLRPTSMT